MYRSVALIYEIAESVCSACQPLILDPASKGKGKETRKTVMMDVPKEETPSRHMTSGFLAIWTRIRKADASKDGTDGAVFNLKHGVAPQMRGKGLPMYNIIYIGALMTVLKNRTPEGLLAYPTNADRVVEVLSCQWPV